MRVVVATMASQLPWINEAIERGRRLLERDGELQRAAPSPEAQESLRDPALSSLARLTRICERFADRACLGERDVVMEGGRARALPSFRYLTYAELWSRVRALATGLRRMGLADPGARVAITGAASIDWVVADLRCLYLAAVSVPLPTIATADELRAIVTDAEPSLVATSVESFEAVASILPDAPSVRALLVINLRDGDAAQADALALAHQRLDEQGSGITVATIADVERLGRTSAPVPPVEPPSGGSTASVLAPDMSTLFDDIRIVRPTVLFAVPRVANMIYQHFQSEVARRANEPDAEARVIEEMRRSFLGDRLLYLITGSAPTAPEVTDFLSRCFEAPIVDGYGMTESGVIALSGTIVRDNVEEWKLVDVPELGYTTRDRPNPRGELLVKTRAMVPGYYENEDAIRQLFDGDGFLHTGDIVEQIGPEQIRWIDRRKNVLKLAQGEFVAVSQLEELYGTGSPFIKQVYLHGSSLWSFLLGVVVADRTTDKPLLRGEIHRIAATHGLRGYEIPRDFLVETAPFTRAAGLLTESAKPSRPGLRAKYGERLDALHDEIERRQREELQAAVRAPGASVRDVVTQLFAVTLGIPAQEIATADQSFQKLGGDSLGAVQLVARIKEACGVDVPVSLVLNPASSVGDVVRAVEARISGAATPRVTFADVHGEGAQTIRADDLRIERFLPARELDAPSVAIGQGRPVVVLTGANGFLGRFLTLDLIERVAASNGRVVAIVRAPNDALARERLAASFAGGDPKLAARFAASNGRLEVVAGDLIAPQFGMPDARWDTLASEVTAIVHNGALVNHAFSYVDLFEPNVLGTVEVMRLARRRRAPIAFVSTVGVASGLDRAEPVREDEDAAKLWTRRAVDSGYAVGYATSKWADEILLRDFEARTGVPVSILRCSMILPPRTFRGQVNAGDFLTRLLHSIVVTGIAPRSFYERTATARHFDGLPVDRVASAIGAIALAAQRGFATYHAVDGHFDDGVTLDTIVDWVETAGYDLTRVDDYAEWFHDFRERLLALDPAEQQHSALPIVHQWERPIRGGMAFSNLRLRERLHALGEDADTPDIDADAVRRYLDAMVDVGLLGARVSRGASKRAPRPRPGT